MLFSLCVDQVQVMSVTVSKFKFDFILNVGQTELKKNKGQCLAEISLNGN